MIEAYFAEIEGIVRDFPDVRSYTLRKKVYNRKQGYIGGTIVFENGYRLDFIEVKDIEVTGRIKYRYQCMDEHQALVFRYDNAPRGGRPLFRLSLRTKPRRHSRFVRSRSPEPCPEPCPEPFDCAQDKLR